MESPETDRSSTSSPTSMEGNAVGFTETLKNDMETETQKLDGERSLKSMAVNEEVSEVSAGGATADVNGMDRLLQRHKNEIMYELRKLQNGDRPVTGQGNKEAVEHFFTRALDPNTETEAESARHRPESVVVEVNALVERRPVSSLLQRAGFRRNIEQALRGAISSYRPASPSAGGQSRHSVNNNRPETEQRTHRVNTNRPETEQRTPRVNRSQNPAEQNGARERTTPQPFIPVPPAIPEDLHEQHPNVQQPRPDLEPAVRSPDQPYFEQLLPPRPSGRLAQQWLQQNVPLDLDPNEQRQMTLEELTEQAQQEDFIAEISDLLQRQLVTNSLTSSFRNSLEGLMRNRMDSTGLDGQQVERLIQALPRTIPRNDFSHLGIGVQGGLQGSLSDHLDDISVISATAAVTVPYAQSNMAVNRELAAMKAQMQEMKNMMKLSFDLQMDIQRSIRQEVSAALSAAMPGLAASGGVSQPVNLAPQKPANTPVNESTCLICLDSSVDSVLYQCGHMCVCHTCGLNLKSRGAHCPVCRAPIRDIIRAYKSNHE